MADSMIPTVSNMAVPKPQPLEAQVPSGVRIASLNPVGDGARYIQAANNSRESMAAVNQVHNDNLRALATFSQEAASKLAEYQNDAFSEGYLKSMQGKSLEDIQKDQGFVSKLFGDGSAVRGARAAQVQVAGDSMISWLQQNQNDLAALPMDAQRKALADQMESLKTGDQEQDHLVASRMMQVFPTLMESLTRTSHVENQRKAAIAQTDTLAQKGSNLQFISEAVAKGNMSPERYTEAMNDYMQHAEPLPGQTKDSWRALMQSAVSDMTGKGQFEAASSLKERLSSELLPEERAQLDAQVNRQQAQWLVNNPMSRDFTAFKVEVPQQIMAGRFSSLGQLDEAIDNTNRAHQNGTHSLTPLINNEERSEMHNRYQRYMEEQAKANSKPDMESLYMRGIATGSPELMKAASLETDRKAVIDNQVAQQFSADSSGKAGEVVGRLAAAGYTNGFIKEPIDRTMGMLMGGGVPTQEAVDQVKDTYQKLSKSPYGMGAAEAYFGTEGLKVASEMESLDMSNPANVRYISDRAQQASKNLSLPPEVLKKATDTVGSEFEGGWLSRTFGSRVTLGAGTSLELKNAMTSATAQVMAEYPTFSADKVMSIATQRVRQNTSMLGDRLILGPGARDVFKTLNSQLDVPLQSPEDGRLNGLVDTAIKTKMPDLDYTIGNMYAYPNGQMRLTLAAPDGTFRDVVMPISDIAKASRKDTKAQEAGHRALHDQSDDSKTKHLITLPSGKKMWTTT